MLFKGRFRQLHTSSFHIDMAYQNQKIMSHGALPLNEKVQRVAYIHRAMQAMFQFSAQSVSLLDTDMRIAPSICPPRDWGVVQ